MEMGDARVAPPRQRTQRPRASNLVTEAEHCERIATVRNRAEPDLATTSLHRVRSSLAPRPTRRYWWWHRPWYAACAVCEGLCVTLYVQVRLPTPAKP